METTKKWNKMFRMGMLAMVLTFGLVVTGCATRLGAFTVISTKNIDLEQGFTI